jgi:LDH2 family malate/lactate/ureidoglycolate dehydrogenase
MPTIRGDHLEEVMRATLKGAGATEEEASFVSRTLLDASLCGVDSHGIVNLKPYIDAIEKGKIKCGAQVNVVKESASSALIDGNRGFGQIACKKATEIAINKAEKNMVAVVGISNGSHIGRLGFYSEMIVRKDMIGIVYVATDASVAPHGGMRPMFGTNPFSYGFPAGKERPLIIDFATATSAEGKIRAALSRGEKIPEGWILDKNGYPTTNPADLYEPPLPPAQIKFAGAQLPMAGHKGFGLALAVDIIGGALTGTGCDGDIPDMANGTVVQALNIEAFCPIDDYKKRVDKLIRDVKAAPKRPGTTEIMLPGEPEARTKESRLKSGIPVPDITWRTTLDLARKYGVDAEGILSK